MALSNLEIKKVLKKHRPNLFFRVDAYDQFDPKICPYFPIAIVANTFPIRKRNGGHWVALYIDSEKNGIYFDSTGLEPHGRFREFFKHHAISTVYNAATLQLNNYSCGHHVVFFVMQIQKKKSLKKILNLYSTHFNFDAMVMRYFKTL